MADSFPEEYTDARLLVETLAGENVEFWEDGWWDVQTGIMMIDDIVDDQARRKLEEKYYSRDEDGQLLFDGTLTVVLEELRPKG